MLFVSLLISLDELVFGYIEGLKENRAPDDFIWEGVDGTKHGKMKDFTKEYNMIRAELNILRRLTDNTEFDYFSSEYMIQDAWAKEMLSDNDEEMFREYLK